MGLWKTCRLRLKGGRNNEYCAYACWGCRFSYGSRHPKTVHKDQRETLYVNFRIIKVWEIFCGLAINVFLAVVAKYMYKKNMISKQQSISLILLGIYLEVLFALTLLLRIPTDQRRIKIKVFWSWEHIYQNKSLSLLIDNVLNLCMFFPVGCLGFVLAKGK